MVGAHHQFVFAQESIQRLPELALLAGSIQRFLAATLKGLGHRACTERNFGTSAQCCAHLARNHLRRSHISVDKVLPASSLNYFACLKSHHDCLDLPPLAETKVNVTLSIYSGYLPSGGSFQKKVWAGGYAPAHTFFWLHPARTV